MKNSKKLFLIVLSVLAVAFISCKDKGTDPTPFKVSDIAGNCSGGEGLVAFTISGSGNITMTAPEEVTYQIPDADWNSEKTEYTVTADSLGVPGASITFTSATSGTATYGESVSISKQ